MPHVQIIYIFRDIFFDKTIDGINKDNQVGVTHSLARCRLQSSVWLVLIWSSLVTDLTAAGPVRPGEVIRPVDNIQTAEQSRENNPEISGRVSCILMCQPPPGQDVYPLGSGVVVEARGRRQHRLYQLVSSANTERLTKLSTSTPPWLVWGKELSNDCFLRCGVFLKTASLDPSLRVFVVLVIFRVRSRMSRQ